jgi:hypothetical protein
MMREVGFEPTHLSIAELKSAALNHSGEGIRIEVAGGNGNRGKQENSE